ncbi:MAG TPA: SRPBCC family protein [Actinomycetota bacterium]
MTRIETDLETTVPPDKVRAALLDFSPRRPEIWPGIASSMYEVYSVGETSADVKEGTKMPGMKVWARERYDWSNPDTVTWTVQESNFSAPGSYVSATVTPREGGGSHVHIVWDRTPTSLVGRIVMFAIVRTKGKPIAASFKKAMDKLERETGPSA